MKKFSLKWISFLVALLLMSSYSQAVEFEIEIQVSVPDPSADQGKATNRLKAGGNQNASTGFDPLFDVPSLFLVDQNGESPLRASFPHPEFSPEKDSLWRDFRGNQLPLAWTFEVSSSKDQSPITLQWVPSVVISGCDSVEFYLTDETTGQVIDMQMATNYTYTNENGIDRIFLLNAKAIRTAPPQTPGQLWSPRLGKSGVLLTWSFPAGGTEVGYRIERKQEGGIFELLETSPLSTNKYLDRSIVRGKIYTYRVTAVSNSGCESNSSEELTLTIP